MSWFLLVPAALVSGAIIGFVGGVLGIGGGLLAIPLLGIFLNMDQQMAQGTALIMVLPAVLTTVRKYNQKEAIDFKAASCGAAGSVVFTWIGAQIALGIDPVMLRRIYALFVLGIAIFYFYQSGRAGRSKKPPVARRKVGDYHKGWFALMGTLAGITGGIFGVGGSVIVVPILTSFFRLSQTDAQGIALTMLIPGIVVALFAYASHGQADWLLGLPLALGSIFMVPYGVKLAFALPEPKLKLTFACMLLVIMMLLLVKT